MRLGKGSGEYGALFGWERMGGGPGSWPDPPPPNDDRLDEAQLVGGHLGTKHAVRDLLERDVAGVVG